MTIHGSHEFCGADSLFILPVCLGSKHVLNGICNYCCYTVHKITHSVNACVDITISAVVPNKRVSIYASIK